MGSYPISRKRAALKTQRPEDLGPKLGLLIRQDGGDIRVQGGVTHFLLDERAGERRTEWAQGSSWIWG